MSLELDPRWNWVDISTLEEGRGTTFVRAECNHLEVEPVHDISGELVARWCRTCDRQWTIPIEIR